MDAWVDRLAELTGMGYARIELSLSHLRLLVPEGKFCCLAAVVTGFLLVLLWQETRLNRAQARKSHTHHL
jgi:hypothetical protein